MEWIPVGAWIFAVLVALVGLGFCGYEIRWKTRRLRADVAELQTLAAQVTQLQGAIADTQQRLGAMGLR